MAVDSAGDCSKAQRATSSFHSQPHISHPPSLQDCFDVFARFPALLVRGFPADEANVLRPDRKSVQCVPWTPQMGAHPTFGHIPAQHVRSLVVTIPPGMPVKCAVQQLSRVMDTQARGYVLYAHSLGGLLAGAALHHTKHSIPGAVFLYDVPSEILPPNIGDALQYRQNEVVECLFDILPEMKNFNCTKKHIQPFLQYALDKSLSGMLQLLLDKQCFQHYSAIAYKAFSAIISSGTKFLNVVVSTQAFNTTPPSTIDSISRTFTVNPEHSDLASFLQSIDSHRLEHICNTFGVTQSAVNQFMEHLSVHSAIVNGVDSFSLWKRCVEYAVFRQ